MPGRTRKEKGREGKSEIAQEVVAGIKKKASVHEDANANAQRTAGQSAKQNRDRSQIESEKEEEEDDWEKENQMEVQRDEDHKLEEILGQRSMEGSTLQLDVMQKAPELAVHERMTKGEEVKCTKEKKQVKGCSTEEMRDKVNSHVEIDTEEMIEWRSLRQEEIDQCWKKLTKK